MKRALIVLVIVLFAAAFIRGWFVLSGPHRQPEFNKVDVNLSVDPDKMKADAERVKEKTEEWEDKARDEFRGASRTAKEGNRP